MIIVTTLSAVFISAFGMYFIYRNYGNKLVLTAFLVKIIAGICLGILYKYHYRGGDTFNYFDEAGLIAKYFLSDPVGHAGIFFRDATAYISDLRFYEQPRALFFSKVVSMAYVITGGNYWLIAIMLSIINFLCLKVMVDQITNKFPFAQRAAELAFYFLPTFVFWTSGLLKESLAIGAFALLVAQSLYWSKPGRKITFWRMAAVLMSAFLLWSLKYFYAAVLIPILLLVLFYERVQLKKAQRIMLAGGVFVLTTTVFSAAHYNLGIQRIFQVVYENYLLGSQSGNGAIHYYHFDGSVFSILVNLPVAIFSGLFRPFIFESSNVMQLIVSLENAAVLVIAILAAVRIKRLKFKHTPWLTGAVFLVLILDIFIAFSTPNFGTLSRFKVAYWPFFVMLIAIVMQYKNKSQAL